MTWKTELWKSLSQKRIKKKKKRSKVSLRDLWDSIKWTNVQNRGFRRRQRERT